MMVSHFHGQIWNGADLARSLGVSEHTVRSYVDLLTGTFLLRQKLQPWFANIAKRQYKARKSSCANSGLLHALLGLESDFDLSGHPKFGASWEGFAIEQLLAVAGSDQAYYWGTHSGAELDLILFRGRRQLWLRVSKRATPRK